MNQRIVFVGGIHGAGKTTMSRPLAVLLSASHVTAGTLIRETAGSQAVTVGLGNKVVPDLNANQALLLQGLRAYRRRFNGPIVLDGHFSLLEPDGAVVAIPLAVYRAIAPVAVVLVQTSPQVVYERLVQRDGAAPPLNTILSFAEREYANAESVCAALGIPFLTAQGDATPENVAQVITSRLCSLVGGAA